MSARRDQPFVAINCSALPGALIESIIFGHERGAFTGAHRRTRGQLEMAERGTLLLDEIAEMPGDLQAKLLRVLEDRSFRPLGAETDVPLRARILAATHVDLEKRIADGRFREDLFYRLNVVSVRMPSLGERTQDIPELVQSFLTSLSRKLRFSEAAMAWLTRRRWPGNIRELRNVIERVALLAEEDWIDAATLEALADMRMLEEGGGEIDRLARMLLALAEPPGSKFDLMEGAILRQAMAVCGGNKSAAARLVGVDRRVIERRLERLSGESPDDRDPDSDDR